MGNSTITSSLGFGLSHHALALDRGCFPFFAGVEAVVEALWLRWVRVGHHGGHAGRVVGPVVGRALVGVVALLGAVATPGGRLLQKLVLVRDDHTVAGQGGVVPPPIVWTSGSRVACKGEENMIY